MKVFLLVLAIISVNCFKEWWENSIVPDLNKDNFFDYVGKDKWVFVKFYTTWCGYCRMMAPEYDKLYSNLKRDDVLIRRLQGDTNEEITYAYGIHSFPKLVLYKPGSVQAYKVYSDYRTADLMMNWINELAKKTESIRYLDDSKNLTNNKNNSLNKTDISNKNKSTNDNANSNNNDRNLPVDEKEIIVSNKTVPVQIIQNNTIIKNNTDINFNKSEDNEENKVVIVKSNFNNMNHTNGTYTDNEQIYYLKEEIKFLNEKLENIKKEINTIKSESLIPKFKMFDLVFLSVIIFIVIAAILTIRRIYKKL